MALLGLSIVCESADAQGVFIRSDCNGTQEVDISDAIFSLNFLFTGGREPPCLDACDFDDGEELDLSDPVATLLFIFLGARPPSPPFPFENLDPDGDTLTCLNGRDPPDELRVSPATVIFYQVGHSTVLAVAAVNAGIPEDVRLSVSTNYSTSDAAVASVSPDGTVIAEGVGLATISVLYRGVTKEVAVSVVPGADGSPVVRITTPPNGSVLTSGQVTVAGVVDDPDASLTLGGSPIANMDGVLQATADLVLGSNTLEVVATGLAGEGQASVTVTRAEAGSAGAVGPDGEPLPEIPVVIVPQGSTPDTTPPQIAITSPSGGATLLSAHVEVTGTVNEPDAVVRVNGVLAALEPGGFRAFVELPAGNSVLRAEAVDPVGNSAEATAAVTVDDTQLRIAITSPPGSFSAAVDLGAFSVSGTVSPSGTPVSVNGVAAQVVGSAWSVNLTLPAGAHDLMATAALPGALPRRAQATRTVFVEGLPPQVDLAYPPEAQLLSPEGYRVETTSTSVKFAGSIFDAGVPREAEGTLILTIGGVVATVSGGTFTAVVPLVIGTNNVQLVATDARGNSTQRAYKVVRGGTAAPTLAAVAGDGGTFTAGTGGSVTLIARARDEAGSLEEAKVLTFRVVQGDGVFEGGGRIRKVVTASDGLASLTLFAGSQAGAGSHVVTVSSPSHANSPLAFISDLLVSSARVLMAHRRRSYTGVSGEDLGEPVQVRLTDGFGNPVRGPAVSFTVVEGSALVEGVNPKIVTTGAGGVASAVVNLPQGDSRSVIEVGHPGAVAVQFEVLGRVPGAPADTAVHGVTVDERGQPIEGALVKAHLSGSTLDTLTDRAGFFRLASVPAGDLLLTAEAAGHGDTSVRAVVLPGHDNRLEAPVRLVQTDGPQDPRSDAEAVLPAQETILTLPALPGVRLEVVADSTTFPDGSSTGTITLAAPNRIALAAPAPDDIHVHVPLAIYPTGIHFDPPARLVAPNIGGEAGRRAPLFLHFPGAGFLELPGGLVQDGVSLEASGARGLQESGVLFFSQPLPLEGRTGVLSGRVAVTAPGFLDTPQHDASHVLGLNVYAHSGEFFLEETDLVLPAPGRGVCYRFRRRYESRHRFAGALGPGWEHEYEDRRLHPGVVVDNVVRANGAGRFDEYLYDAAGDLYVSPIGVFSRLFVDAQDFFVERDVDGTRYKYHPFDGSPLAGRLLMIEDRNGNSLSFTRSAGGLISQVSDSLGRVVTYGHDAEGRIESVTDFTGRAVSFEYDPTEGDLVAVTGPPVTATPNDNNFPLGKRVEYVYASGFADPCLNHNLTDVIDPRESASTKVPRVTVTYGTDSSQPSFDRVETQVWGGTNATGVPAGGTVSFTYGVLRPPLEGAVSSSELESFLLSAVGTTTYTDQESRVSDVTFSGAGLPLELRVHTVPGSRPRDPSSLHPPPGTVPPYYSTRWSWTREGLLASKVEPRGNRLDHFYDEAAPIRHAQAALVRTEHHPVPTGGAPVEPAVTTFLRDPLFGVVVEEVTPRGNDLAFEPPLGGPGGPARYATKRFLDYQETADAATLALEAGVTEVDLTDAFARVGIALGLGDLNGDGSSAERSGNVLKEEPPSVTLPDTTVEASSVTSVYNAFGQLTERTDESGRTVRFEYHPETDYDGDGVPNGGGGDPLQGGFLARRIAVLDDDGPGPPDEIVQESYVYEAQGFLAKRTDGNGNEEFHVHNQLGQLVELRLPSPIKYRRHFDYDADDNIVRVRIENYGQTDGGTTHALFPANQWLDTEVEWDLLGRPVTLTREVSGGEIGPAKSIATPLRYHPAGALARVEHPVPGTDETWTYDERDLVIEHARGAETADEALTETFYDENGDPVLQQTAASIREERRYDGFSRLVAVIDAVGGARVFERDIEGHLLADSFLGTPGGPTPTTRDGIGSVLLERSSFEYDERGRIFETRKALFNRGVDPETGQPLAAEVLVDSRWHDGAGRVVRRTDPEGGLWLREYDGAGRVDRVTQPDGALQLFTYDSNDNVIGEVTERFTLDPVDPTAAGDPDYDAEGRFREVTTILRVFDPLDRLTLLVDSSGGVWRARYDSSNNLTFSSDATGPSIAPDPEFDSIVGMLTPIQTINLNSHGNRRRFVYDNIGRLVEARHELRENGEGGAAIDLNNSFNFDGIITEQFEWDDNSRLQAWVNDTGGRTAVDYDGAGYVTQKTWPDLTVEVHTRDRDGNLLGLLDTGATTFTQTFDGLHRLVERNVTRVGVEGTARQRFEYDGLSALTLAFDDNGPGDPTDDSLVLFRRDSAGNRVEEIQDGFVVLSAYDRGSRPVSRRYADGRAVSTPRDAAGHITSLADATSVYATYRHFGSGALLDKLLPSGLELSFLREDAGGVLRKNAYDVGGGVREQVYRDGTGAIFRGFEYGRDRNGFKLYERPLHGFDPSGDVWRYDSVYRIERYLPDVFDPRVPPINPFEKLDFFTDGNHSWRFIVVDQGSRELEVNERSAYECSECGATQEVLFVYDGRGNLTAAGNISFIYDALGRIVRVERNALVVGTYRYDAVGAEDPEAFVGRGRRVSKNVLRPSSGQPAGFIRFIFVGNRMAEERDENDLLLRQYLYEEDGRPAVLLRPSGASGTEAHAFLHDDAGSISALVSSSGQLVETMMYGPFGEPQIRNPFELPITFPSLGNTLGFGGIPHDFELGLHLVGGRHFDPNLGRFLSDASDPFPAVLLQLNGYLLPGLPGLPGEVVGQGSAARRAAYLEPFRVEILTEEDAEGAREMEPWRARMDLKAVLEGRR